MLIKVIQVCKVFKGCVNELKQYKIVKKPCFKGFTYIHNKIKIFCKKCKKILKND